MIADCKINGSFGQLSFFFAFTHQIYFLLIFLIMPLALGDRVIFIAFKWQRCPCVLNTCDFFFCSVFRVSASTDG